ncbi:MAG: hypothetical protein ABFR53_01665 [Actinomycetota bacterium]
MRSYVETCVTTAAVVDVVVDEVVVEDVVVGEVVVGEVVVGEVVVGEVVVGEVGLASVVEVGCVCGSLPDCAIEVSGETPAPSSMSGPMVAVVLVDGATVVSTDATSVGAVVGDEGSEPSSLETAASKTFDGRITVLGCST